MNASMIRAVGKQTGLTQAAFAEAFRIPAGTLRDLEKDRTKAEAVAANYLELTVADPFIVAALWKRDLSNDNA